MWAGAGWYTIRRVESNGTADELREALAPLWRGGEFRLVVLFGSVAAGRNSRESDLDLALMPVGEIDEVAVTAEVIRLTHRNDVDVVNLAHADPMVLMEVARGGVVLFASDPSQFTEFRSLAFRRYADTEKLRRAQRRALDLFQRRHEPR